MCLRANSNFIKVPFPLRQNINLTSAGQDGFSRDNKSGMNATLRGKNKPVFFLADNIKKAGFW